MASRYRARASRRAHIAYGYGPSALRSARCAHGATF